MAYANVDSIVVAWLTANVFTGTGSDRVRVTEGESDRPAAVQPATRLVTVTKIPSSPGDAQPTLDVADVEVDCFARNRSRARSLAETVRAELRFRLEKTTDAGTGAFVKQVRPLSTPSEAPWEARDTVRFSATYRIWLHHNPLA